MYAVNPPIRSPVRIIAIVQNISDRPNLSHPMSTRKAVTFAIVATVIQPKYMEKGSFIKILSLTVKSALIKIVFIEARDTSIINIKTRLNAKAL